LEQLNTHSRPIHCSDSKREILYIKNDNQWTKDDEQKTNLSKAIKEVANKNIKQISEWQKLNPEYNDPDSKQNDKYMKIVLNSMSGSTIEEQKNNINKIIKNVAKEVVIEKM
jgi:signal recognition particle subunit SEC65